MSTRRNMAISLLLIILIAIEGFIAYDYGIMKGYNSGYDTGYIEGIKEQAMLENITSSYDFGPHVEVIPGQPIRIENVYVYNHTLNATEMQDTYNGGTLSDKFKIIHVSLNSSQIFEDYNVKITSDPVNGTTAQIKSEVTTPTKYEVHLIQQPTFSTLNKTEQEYVLYVMQSSALGRSIDGESPSRNASLVAIQELEKAGVK